MLKSARRPDHLVPMHAGPRSPSVRILIGKITPGRLIHRRPGLPDRVQRADAPTRGAARASGAGVQDFNVVSIRERRHAAWGSTVAAVAVGRVVVATGVPRDLGRLKMIHLALASGVTSGGARRGTPELRGGSSADGRGGIDGMPC